MTEESESTDENYTVLSFEMHQAACEKYSV